LDREWAPQREGGALYIRPVYFAIDEALQVRLASHYRLVVLTSPVGPYFAGPVSPVAEERYVRAFPGGTGDIKPAGNYAGSLLAARDAYALFYYVVDDFVARRSPHRDEHLRLAREAHQRGELLLAGALSDPADRALLVFRSPDISIVEDFARHDPYVRSGLVRSWEVRSWNVVIGNEPSDTPLTRGVP
jgi:uncharacterized protein